MSQKMSLEEKLDKPDGSVETIGPTSQQEDSVDGESPGGNLLIFYYCVLISCILSVHRKYTLMKLTQQKHVTK